MPESVGGVLLRIIPQKPRMVVSTRDGATLDAPLTYIEVSIVNSDRDTDDDFEPIEVETGEYFRFECHGDSRVRRYFQQRSIIDGSTHAPREHIWAVAYDENGRRVTMQFAGRLYDYGDEPISASKKFKITGKIRFPKPAQQPHSHK